MSEAEAAPAVAESHSESAAPESSEPAIVQDQSLELPQTPVPQPPEPEPLAAPQEKPKPKDDELKFAQKMSILTKRDREIRQRESELKKQINDPTYKLFQEAMQSEDPIKLLGLKKWDYQYVTDFLLNDSKPPADSHARKMQDKLEQQEKELKELRATYEKAQHDKIISEHKQNIRKFVDSDQDKFELIKTYDAYEQVWDLIQAYYDQTKTEESPGDVLDTDKACEQVESYLEDEVKRLQEEAKRAAGLKRFQPKEAPTNGRDPKPPESQRTLTNRLNAAQTPQRAEAHLDPEESKRRAARFLEDELKKQGRWRGRS